MQKRPFAALFVPQRSHYLLHTEQLLHIHVCILYLHTHTEALLEAGHRENDVPLCGAQEITQTPQEEKGGGSWERGGNDRNISSHIKTREKWSPRGKD